MLSLERRVKQGDYTRTVYTWIKDGKTRKKQGCIMV